MVLQHSSVGKSLHWHVITMILFDAEVAIFPPNYAVIPLFVSFLAWNCTPFLNY